LNANLKGAGVPIYRHDAKGPAQELLAGEVDKLAWLGGLADGFPLQSQDEILVIESLVLEDGAIPFDLLHSDIPLFFQHVILHWHFILRQRIFSCRSYNVSKDPDFIGFEVRRL